MTGRRRILRCTLVERAFSGKKKKNLAISTYPFDNWERKRHRLRCSTLFKLGLRNGGSLHGVNAHHRKKGQDSSPSIVVKYPSATAPHARGDGLAFSNEEK